MLCKLNISSRCLVSTAQPSERAGDGDRITGGQGLASVHKVKSQSRTGSSQCFCQLLLQV
jgi:hypothetical protein